MNKKLTYVAGIGAIAGGMLVGCGSKGGTTGPSPDENNTETQSVREHILNLGNVVEAKGFDYFLSEDMLEVGKFTEDYLLGHDAVIVDPVDPMNAQDSTVLEEIVKAQKFGMNGLDTIIYVQNVQEENPEFSNKEIAKKIVYEINGVADKRAEIMNEAKKDGFAKAAGDIIFYNVDNARFAVQLDQDCFIDENRFILYKGIQDGKADSIAAAVKGPGDNHIGFADATEAALDNMGLSGNVIYGKIKKDLEAQASAGTVLADTINFGKDTIYIQPDTVKINDTLYVIGADTIPADSIPVDTGVIDTGIIDTGIVDTGIVDTGVIDTGVVDTGAVVVPMLSDSAVAARRNQFCADLPSLNPSMRKADEALDYLKFNDTTLVMLDTNYLTGTKDSANAFTRVMLKCGDVNSAKADSINTIMARDETSVNANVDSLVQEYRAMPLDSLVSKFDMGLRNGQLDLKEE